MLKFIVFVILSLIASSALISAANPEISVAVNVNIGKHHDNSPVGAPDTEAEVDSAEVTEIAQPIIVYLFHSSDLKAPMDNLLTPTIKAISSKITVVSYDWKMASIAELNILRRPKGTKFILVGAGKGANVVTSIQARMKNTVFDLITGQNPVKSFPKVRALLPNTKYAICLHNTETAEETTLATFTPGPGFDSHNYEFVLRHAPHGHLAPEVAAAIQKVVNSL